MGRGRWRRRCKRLFARTKNAKLAKVEHWLLLALDCIRQIGVAGTLWLVVVSFVAWVCEGLLYVSAAQLIGLADGLGRAVGGGGAGESFVSDSELAGRDWAV